MEKMSHQRDAGDIPSIPTRAVKMDPAKQGMDDLPKMRLFLYSRGDCVNRPAIPKAVGHEGMGTRLQFQFPGLTLDARS